MNPGENGREAGENAKETCGNGREVRENAWET